MDTSIIYNKSNLCALLKETKDDIDIVTTEINNTLFGPDNDFNLTKDQIVDFVTDYKQIRYTDDNIFDYVNLAEYMLYDFLQDFAKYIVIEHVLKMQHFLEYIHQFPCIYNFIEKYLCSAQCRVTDVTLQYISKYIQVQQLNCGDNVRNLTDEGIKHLTKLRRLVCSHCEYITDSGLKHLTQLEQLNCSSCKNITDNGLKHLAQYKDI